MLMITTGAVIARPDDLLPLASKLAQSFIATGETAKADVAPVPPAPQPNAETDTLPGFVPARHELRFPSSSASGSEPQSQVQPGTAAPGSRADQAGKGAGVPPRAGSAAAIPIVPVVSPQNAKAGVKAGVARPEGTAGASGNASNDVDPIQAALNSPDAGGGPQRIAGISAGAGNETAPDEPKPLAAKMLFGKVKGPSLLQARSIGSYSRGCLAGGVALPVDGPAWQAMRLSRNRIWGHPRLIETIEDLATKASEKDGWSGLLVGDISQPRGGPMLTGHASHQVGLDADVWLTPMPDRTLTRKERENMSATSMLDKTSLAVDPKVFTDKQVRLIKRAASYPQVERVLVHPAIKKALCEAAGTDRGWLGKVRPYYGHYYHMHIRVGCPPDSIGCVPQKAVTGEDGCGKEVEDWLALLARPPKPVAPGAKKTPAKQPLMLAQLPADCRMVLESGADGLDIPPEALLAPATKKSPTHHASTQRGDGQHGAGKASHVVLKPVKERHRHTKREAKAQ
ncbi:MAG TPA: penicillin-insensitive murein endopeptidase [Hyphomicrobium sp.]|nr:penicillin-insensitive murein endopeptidase [Hyphomicrobium sp.]